MKAGDVRGLRGIANRWTVRRRAVVSDGGHRVDAPVTAGTLVFEGWRFDRQALRLYRQNATEAVQLGSRAANILALLLERPGEVVSKDVIMAAVWPGVAVEPNNLNVQVAALRRLLDGDRVGESCIQTVS